MLITVPSGRDQGREIETSEWNKMAEMVDGNGGTMEMEETAEMAEAVGRWPDYTLQFYGLELAIIVRGQGLRLGPEG